MAKDSLREYSEKRAFQATPEPAPVLARGRSGPLLFVVQQHHARQLHYDLRLECDGVLKSWAVPKGPSLDPSEKRFAAQTEDHPFEYGAFEGVIPAKQYGAGEVIVWDCGVYSPDEGNVTFFDDREGAEREVREGLARGKLSFQLRGEKLKGSFALVRMKDPKQWLVIKHKDRFATTNEVTLRDRSVLPGPIPAERLIPAGTLEPMPEKVAPMRAEASDHAFNHDDWMWEPKLDGYRVLAFIGADGVKLRSQRGLDLAGIFPRLAAELGKQGSHDMLLDGELVAFDANGKPSFAALQARARLKTEREIAAADASVPVAFFCFDLLHFAGIDLRGAPYRDRRRFLAQCVLPSARVQPVHATADGVALEAAALESGFEGVVGKRLDARYEAGRRSKAWLSVKPPAGRQKAR